MRVKYWISSLTVREQSSTAECSPYSPFGVFMRARPILVAAASVLVAVLGIPAAGADRSPDYVKEPVATGTGGAVASAEFDASKAGIETLQSGGNAIDAAVASREHARRHRAVRGRTGRRRIHGHLPGQDRTRSSTIDGREKCAAACTSQLFIDPATGQAAARSRRPAARACRSACRAWSPPGPTPCAATASAASPPTCSPAIDVARRGFTIDGRLRPAGAGVAARPAGIHQQPRPVPHRRPASRCRSAPRCATPIWRAPTPTLARHGAGLPVRRTARRRHRAHRAAPAGLARRRRFTVRPGIMTAADVAELHGAARAPTHVNYRGLDVYGMAPPSCGGLTIGEALNILSGFAICPSEPRAQALFQYLEASPARVRRPQRLHRRLATTSTCRSTGCSTRTSPPPAAA